MRAVQVSRLDGPDAIRLVDVPEPSASDVQVVVEVAAAGVNFPDVLLTRGGYQLRPDLPFVPGSEVAGTVRSAPASTGLRVGDRVAAFCTLGGFAEIVAVDPRCVFPLPTALSYDVAAGLPMNYLTVHFALTRRGRLRPGETVLVHGAGGGVGSAAVQLAHALGARVLALASNETKGDLAKRAGADVVVRPDGFREAVAELTQGRGVDVVVDPVGGDRFTDSLRSLAPEGRLLVIGFTAGEIPTVKVNRLLLNNIEVVGVGWGAFWTRHPDYLHEQWRELTPMLERGALDPLVPATYPLADAGKALSDMEQRRASGKIVLTV
jgi:NADPH2:quinone reductase